MPTSLISTGLEFPDATVQTSFFPTGTILIWSGSVVTIPTGWYLCDGTNGTPNLTDKFIVGAGSLYSIGDSGGSADASVASHTHNSVTSNTAGVHNHTQASPHTHTITGPETSSPGGAHVHPEGVQNLGTSDGDPHPSNHSHAVSFSTSTFAAHTHPNISIEFIGNGHQHPTTPSSTVSWPHGHYLGRINHYIEPTAPPSTTRPAIHLPGPAHPGPVTITTQPSGNHTHSYTVTPAGAHTHPVTINPSSHDHGPFSAPEALTNSGDHTHPTPGGTINPAGSHSHPLTLDSVPFTTTSNGEHSHDIVVNPTGSSATNANLPPYYALAYIMKSN